MKRPLSREGGTFPPSSMRSMASVPRKQLRYSPTVRTSGMSSGAGPPGGPIGVRLAVALWGPTPTTNLPRSPIHAELGGNALPRRQMTRLHRSCIGSIPRIKKPTVRSPWRYSQHTPGLPPPPPRGGWVGGILFPGCWLRATGRQEHSLSVRPSCSPSEANGNTPGPPPHTQTLPRALFHPHLQYPSPTLPYTNKNIGYSFGDVCIKHELFSRTPPWYTQASYQVSRHPPGLEECRGNGGNIGCAPCTSGNRIFSDIFLKHTHCETF